MLSKEIIEKTTGTNNLEYITFEGRKGVLTPMTAMRKVIGKRMAESLQKAPQICVGLDVDMTEALELKNTLKEQNIKVTVNDILVKSVALALLNYPILNATYTEQGIFIIDEINIGVAVGVENGLMVPVIKNADMLSLEEINKISTELSEKAKNGRLKLNEMSGGTFTISNSGVYGVDRCESILNPPEAGILAVASMKKRPVVIDEQILILPLMPLTLTYDHRVLDGGPAALFLQELKKIIENPREYL